MTHFTIVDYGTVWLVWPLSARAADWLQETAPEQALFFHDALAVEPRYVVDVLRVIDSAGLTVTRPIGRYTIAIVAQHEIDFDAGVGA